VVSGKWQDKESKHQQNTARQYACMRSMHTHQCMQAKQQCMPGMRYKASSASQAGHGSRRPATLDLRTDVRQSARPMLEQG
jgi:hypothetical protein